MKSKGDFDHKKKNCLKSTKLNRKDPVIEFI